MVEINLDFGGEGFGDGHLRRGGTPEQEEASSRVFEAFESDLFKRLREGSQIGDSLESAAEGRDLEFSDYEFVFGRENGLSISMVRLGLGLDRLYLVERSGVECAHKLKVCYVGQDG